MEKEIKTQRSYLKPIIAIVFIFSVFGAAVVLGSNPLPLDREVAASEIETMMFKLEFEIEQLGRQKDCIIATDTPIEECKKKALN